MVNTNLAYDEVLFPLEPEIVVNNSPVKWCSVSLSDVVSRGKRLEASVFDVEAKQARKLVENGKYPFTMIGGPLGLSTSYVCGRFKRIWVEKSDFPIYQPSSIVDIKPTPDGYISQRTRTDIEALRVSKGQILMTCSGTIGKIAYVSDTLDSLIFSHDLLRINCCNSEDSGYIYAFLKSKIGNKILLTNSYGAVITHIEPEHLASVPIPNPPWEIKIRIHDLIIRSYSLRDESNSLIDKAHSLLVKELSLPELSDFDVHYFGNPDKVKTFNIKLSQEAGRLDASYHVPIIDAITKHLQGYSEEVTTVGDKRISREVILPGRFKRVYVDEGYGQVLIGGKQIHELDPSNLVPKHWKHWIPSDHIIRVVPANEDIAGYLYIFLSSDYGYQLITRFTYGSVVDEIDDNHIRAIPFPLLKNKEIQKQINDLALAANQKRYEAYRLEQEALRIMDKEVILAK